MPRICRRRYVEHTRDGIGGEKLTAFNITKTKVEPIAHFE
jgi:hypothetical protein